MSIENGEQHIAARRIGMGVCIIVSIAHSIFYVLCHFVVYRVAYYILLIKFCTE